MFVDELGGAPESRWRVRGTGDPVLLRTGTRDVEIPNEFFSHHAYQPPDEIHEQLSRQPIRIPGLGGNIGLFGLYARTRWEVERINSYEPDPANYRLLSATAAANPLDWVAHPEAVSNRAGVLRFRAGAFSESRAATADEDAIDVPMVALYELDHRVDLLKIDIEGSEWPILTDPRLPELEAAAIVMEWHERNCPTRTPHALVTSCLREAGYRIVTDKPRRSTGNIWAAR